MNEATDVLMAVLGEYDVLWDGILFPEILDAEVYDCPGERFTQIQPNFLAKLDRIEALITSIAVVSALAERFQNELFSLGLDAILCDCEYPRDLQFLEII